MYNKLKQQKKEKGSEINRKHLNVHPVFSTGALDSAEVQFWAG